MGGGAFPPVPDWKTYKVGPNTPELQHVQRMLSSLGLKVIILRKNYFLVISNNITYKSDAS